LSAITAAGAANTIANADYDQHWNWALTNNVTGISFYETSAATGGTAFGQYIGQFATKIGSTAIPLGVQNSLNGSQTLPALAITPTWNTTGVVDAALLVNVNNGASGAGSLLLDLQINSGSEFSVDKAGTLVTATPIPVASGGSGAGTFTVHGVLLGETTAAFNATSAGAADSIFMGNNAGATSDPAFKTGPGSCSASTSAVTYNTSTHAWGCNTVGLGSVTTSGPASQYQTAVFSTSTNIVGVSPSATSGIPYISQGSSANPTFGTAVVAGGGTGAITFTVHGVLLGETTNAIAATAAGDADSIFMGNNAGATSDPAFKTGPGSCSSGSSAVTYNTSTHAWGCNTISGSVGSCTEVWGGTGTSNVLVAGDDAISDNTCYNDSGGTRTITAVKCRSDYSSNTITVNPVFGSAGSGTTIGNGTPLQCGNSLAYSSSITVTNASWTTGTGINPVMGTPDTHSTSLAMIVEYTF
jgi:hypothetical protein